jgi:hypothetical protein
LVVDDGLVDFAAGVVVHVLDSSDSQLSGDEAMAELAEQRSSKTNGYLLRCRGQEAAFAEFPYQDELEVGRAACFACS